MLNPMTMNSFGDSITQGTSSSGTVYTSRLATLLGTTLNNYGVSGNRATDQSNVVRSATHGNLSTVLIGTNDSSVYGDASQKLLIYKRLVRSIVAVASGYSLVKGANTSKTSSWAVSSSVGGSAYGNYSTGAATASATVYGKSIIIGYTQTTDASFDSTVTIKVDGTVIDTVTFTGSTDSVTGLSATSGVGALRYTGFTDASHTVEISVASGKSFALEYIMGVGHQPFKDPILLLNIPKKGSYSSPDSSTCNTSYCTVLSDLVDEFKSDGFNIGLVDINSILVPSTDLYDSLHPNDTGNTKIANACYDKLCSMPEVVTGTCPTPYGYPASGNQVLTGKTVTLAHNGSGGYTSITIS